MKKSKTEKNFIKLPRYEGGKKAFNAFIKENLIYPKEALEKGVEGTVHLAYEVDDMGVIANIRVEKGVGYGCDEEAIRLVSLMWYEKIKNRGLRVKSTIKTKIMFKLPTAQPFVYNYTQKKNKEQRKGTSYSYTIEF